jgi:DNA-directed RNA polymerase specialized sigma24 family protein
VHDAHDYDAIWRGSGATLWRAVYAYSGGRRDVADDAVAEAFARVMARGVEVRDPLAYLYRVAFRVASAELVRSGKEVAEVPEIAVADPTQNGLPDLLGALKELTPAQRRYARAPGGTADGHLDRGGKGASDARSPPAGVAPR